MMRRMGIARDRMMLRLVMSSPMTGRLVTRRLVVGRLVVGRVFRLRPGRVGLRARGSQQEAGC